ncbi:MAG: lipoyl synthase [Acidobacteria bacterium]|nr:lipoyl synthase [Acidobacteriota bacterium]
MIDRNRAVRRPEWLKVRWTRNENFQTVDRMVRDRGLHTVCQEARCPNIYECWGQHRTATFMILGDECTRHCTYCAVATSRRPETPDPGEPRRVGEAVVGLGLRHAVITSVDRDDLPDGGAGHFSGTIQAIRQVSPRCRIEVLVPDFNGVTASLQAVLSAAPDVLAHNLETVRRIFPRVRAKGDYQRSLELLSQAAEWGNRTGGIVKSGLMVGLGEDYQEVIEALRDLREAGCQFVTIGQYLPPSALHAVMLRYYSPEEFNDLGDAACRMGFSFVESGPLVRSSYHAHVPFS